jgi:membrane fusion protein, multidrug efflux system
MPPSFLGGFFTHIVERVPVRVAFLKEEILEHPVRPGLSTETYIDVSEPGRSLGVSLAEASTQEYETNIYGDELTDAEALAQEIIRENIVLKRDGPEPA